MRRWDWRVGAALALFLASPPSPGQARDTLPDLSACQPLAACIAMLDRVVPAEDTGVVPRGADFAAKQLSRFGGSAKAELLKRAQGDHPGWRNYAGQILANWPTWSAAEVPALSAALALDHGGAIANALAAVGNDRAIEALVADLPAAGRQSQTGWALVRLAPRSLANLPPLLGSGPRDPGRVYAEQVITDSEDRARPLVVVWTAIATDKTQSTERRIEALRALRAAGRVAADGGAALRPLLAEPEFVIIAEARETLLAIGDPSVAAEAVSACVPNNQRLSASDLPSSSLCLFDLARFRPDPKIVGPRLLEFVRSRNGAEATLAIGVIAKMGYQAAGPTLVTALGSTDWRVAFAAAEALGVLGRADAIPALEKTGREHWLPEVRRQAQASVSAIKSGKPLEPRRDPTTIGAYATAAEDRAGRACQAWRWRGRPIDRPAVRRFVELKTGALTAVDHGEWGGGLQWSPSSGVPYALLKDNVSALEPIEGGALALAGLAHLSSNYGYVVRARQTATGWDVQEIARLPGRFAAISAIAPGSYAAWSSGRVVIFSEQGILGLAECQPGALPTAPAP